MEGSTLMSCWGRLRMFLHLSSIFWRWAGQALRCFKVSRRGCSWQSQQGDTGCSTQVSCLHDGCGQTKCWLFSGNENRSGLRHSANKLRLLCRSSRRALQFWGLCRRIYIRGTPFMVFWGRRVDPNSIFCDGHINEWRITRIHHHALRQQMDVWSQRSIADHKRWKKIWH